MKLALARGERSSLLRRLIAEYSNPDGTIGYVAAFEDHPDWAAQLKFTSPKGKQNVYQAVATLKKRPAKSSALAAEDELLKQIVSEYQSPGGRTLFGEAFAAHPDWRKQLDWENPKNKIRLYGRLKKIKRLLAREKRSRRLENHPANRKALSEPQLNHHQEQDQNQTFIKHCPRCGFMAGAWGNTVGVQFRFCPQCGFNLEMLRAAFTVALRHSDA